MKNTIQLSLAEVDRVLDQGVSHADVLNQRAHLVKSLNELNNLEALDTTQKEKVRWSIEGDENTNYFHGVLNNKRSQLVIRGVLVDGDWIKEPQKVKHEFYSHFADRWRGWIQGCLKSPMGLVLVNESPTVEFQFQNGLFSGINIGPSLKISHLFYADDVVFVAMKEIDQAASFVGCSTFKTPFSYLGVMVGGSMSRIHTWDDIISKILSQMSKWKLKTLSIGGRLTLLKSVIRAEGQDRKMIWVCWKNVLASKKKGVIKAIHGERGMLDRNIPMSKKSLWLDIIREVLALKRNRIDLMMYYRKKVGNGEDTLFWEEVWMGDKALKLQYAKLYALEMSKHITIANKLRHNSIDVTFRRMPRVGAEYEQHSNLSSQINSLELTQMQDR
nr:RNA-directed DNA polymerase, eukaryota, reverse transcriptase zinc-binding domain protein [Tanacetum cinerariifolium]